MPSLSLTVSTPSAVVAGTKFICQPSSCAAPAWRRGLARQGGGLLRVELHHHWVVPVRRTPCGDRNAGAGTWSGHRSALTTAWWRQVEKMDRERAHTELPHVAKRHRHGRM